MICKTMTTVSLAGITITYPTTEMTIIRGKNITILWTGTDTNNVKIELYKNGIFSSQLTGSTSNDGNWTWGPSSTSTDVGSGYTFKITNLITGAFGISQVFNIAPAGSTAITLTYPTTGLTLTRGNTYNITWTGTDTGNVKIDLLKDGAWSDTLVTSVINDGSWTWTLSTTSTNVGLGYTIKITHLTSGVTGTSGVFNIAPAITIIPITITYPSSGATLTRDNTYNITWTGTDSGNVKIDLYKNSVWSDTLVTSVINDGNWSWAMSATSTNVGSGYTIKITHIISGTTGTSGAFNIASAVSAIVITGINVIDNGGGMITASITTSTDGQFKWTINGVDKGTRTSVSGGYTEQFNVGITTVDICAVAV